MHFPTTPGLHDVEATLADGRAARYTLSVPAAVDGPPPLVLVLHYGGTPTRFYGRPLIEYLFEPALRALAPVLIAPESRHGQWHTEENEAFVMALLDGALAAYGADPARVVVAGYSMGAIGTWHFLEHYPERFSAALPVAGYPQRELDTTLPVHAYHSDSDELFPLGPLAARLDALAAAGKPVTLTTAAVNGHFDVNGYAPTLAASAATWLRGVWGG
ncbi:MAG: hypothetical protein AB7I01_06045 [Gammaproteobacteria bacterium]